MTLEVLLSLHTVCGKQVKTRTPTQLPRQSSFPPSLESIICFLLLHPALVFSNFPPSLTTTTKLNCSKCTALNFWVSVSYIDVFPDFKNHTQKYVRGRQLCDNKCVS